MPWKAGKAVAFAVLIWLTGFIWGTFVFMFKAGLAYFASLTVLAAYALLLFVPRLVGRAVAAGSGMVRARRPL